MKILKNFIKILYLIIIIIVFEYYNEKGFENNFKDHIIDNKNLKEVFVNNYTKLINRRKYEKNCNKTLVFGFCSCIDIVVDVYDLISELKKYHNFVEEKKSNLKKLKIPKKIKNFSDLEKFLKYYCYTGAGTEKFIENKNIFKIIKEISKKIKLVEDLGGNSTMMAERSYKENCKTILGAKLNKDYFKKIYNNNIELIEKPNRDINDYHIVVQFQKNKPILGIKPKRFNRIYLNHDIDNANLNLFDKMMDKIEKKKVDFIVLSCFQLLDLNTDKENQKIFEKLENRMKNTDKKFHIELASISDQVLTPLIEKIIPLTQSLGLNEQELFMLRNYYKNKNILKKKTKLFSVIKYLKNMISNTKKDKIKALYGINKLIKYITDLIDVVEEKNYKTNRIHVHSINDHLICTKRNIYKHSRYAMSKGILASLNIVFQKEFKDFDYLKSFYDDFILRIPKIIKLLKQDKKEELLDHKELIKNPNHCWHYNENWKCCIGLTIEMIKPMRVRGLGDNISSTGLIYSNFK